MCDFALARPVRERLPRATAFGRSSTSSRQPRPSITFCTQVNRPDLSIPVHVLVERAAAKVVDDDAGRARAFGGEQRFRVVETDLGADVAVVGGRQKGPPCDGDKRRAAAVGCCVVVDHFNHRVVEIAVLPGTSPVEPVDHGLLEHGVAQERSPAFVPGETSRVQDQGLVVAAQPHDAPGRFQFQVVLANHADARLGGEEVAVGVDLAVTHRDTLHRAQAWVGDGTGLRQTRRWPSTRRPAAAPALRLACGEARARRASLEAPANWQPSRGRSATDPRRCRRFVRARLIKCDSPRSRCPWFCSPFDSRHRSSRDAGNPVQ